MSCRLIRYSGGCWNPRAIRGCTPDTTAQFYVDEQALIHTDKALIDHEERAFDWRVLIFMRLLCYYPPMSAQLERYQEGSISKQIQPLSEQIRVLQEIMEWVVNPDSTQSYFVVVGLPGVGKTTLLEAEQSLTSQPNSRTCEASHLLFSPSNPTGKLGERVIIAATPLEYKRLMQDFKLTDINTRMTIMKSMPHDEALSYVRFHRAKRGALSDETVATLSLGIPLIADRLLADDQLTEDFAALIAANHIVQTLPLVKEDHSIVDAYLASPLPQLVIDKFPEVSYGWGEISSIYQNLGIVIDSIRERSNKLRVPYISPLFLAPESVDIYNEILKGIEGRDPSLYFVFALPDEDFLRVVHTLGLGYIHGSYREDSDWIGASFMFNTPLQERRLAAFGAEQRKVGIWFFRPRDKKPTAIPIETFHVMSIMNGDGYWEQNDEGQFLEELSSTGLSYFVIRAYDHFELKGNPLLVGWALESLFQQMGVGYKVVNQFIQKEYVYDPQQNRITFVPSKYFDSLSQISLRRSKFKLA